MNRSVHRLKDVPTVGFSKPVSPELEFEVMKLSDLIRRVRNIEIIRRPHRLDFYNILHITSGQGEHSSDFRNFRYRKGDTLLIGKGQVHSFLKPESAEGILIVFTEKFLYKNIVKSDYLSIYSLNTYKNGEPVIRPARKAASRLSIDAENIYNEYHFGEDAGKELMMQCLLKVFLIRLERCRNLSVTEQLNPEYADRFRIFQNLLEKHCTEIREAETYARMMNLSYKHMNSICIQASGTSMKKIIDAHTALEMKRRLAVSDVSVNELTELFHFDEPTNLVKFFKKQTGTTPARFRKSLQI